MGEQGGFYPGAVNERPAFHTLGGLNCGNETVRRDKDGNPDDTNGKIVFMSVGMSNCRREFTRFIKDATELPGLNPKLILFNGAIGGMVIEEMTDFDAPYWDILEHQLRQGNLTPEQVQVVWLKQAYGIAPANGAKEKMSAALIDLFTTDETAIGWFLD